jgi:hypothetical protein
VAKTSADGDLVKRVAEIRDHDVVSRRSVVSSMMSRVPGVNRMAKAATKSRVVSKV